MLASHPPNLQNEAVLVTHDVIAFTLEVVIYAIFRVLKLPSDGIAFSQTSRGIFAAYDSRPCWIGRSIRIIGPPLAALLGKSFHRPRDRGQAHIRAAELLPNDSAALFLSFLWRYKHVAALHTDLYTVKHFLYRVLWTHRKTIIDWAFLSFGTYARVRQNGLVVRQSTHLPSEIVFGDASVPTLSGAGYLNHACVVAVRIEAQRVGYAREGLHLGVGIVPRHPSQVASRFIVDLPDAILVLFSHTNISLVIDQRVLQTVATTGDQQLAVDDLVTVIFSSTVAAVIRNGTLIATLPMLYSLAHPPEAAFLERRSPVYPVFHLGVGIIQLCHATTCMHTLRHQLGGTVVNETGGYRSPVYTFNDATLSIAIQETVAAAWQRAARAGPNRRPPRVSWLNFAEDCCSTGTPRQHFERWGPGVSFRFISTSPTMPPLFRVFGSPPREGGDNQEALPEQAQTGKVYKALAVYSDSQCLAVQFMTRQHNSEWAHRPVWAVVMRHGIWFASLLCGEDADAVTALVLQSLHR